VIHISGYTEDEKYHIVRRYLVTKQMELHGLKEGDLTITDDAVRELIRSHTREAGVRNLERMVATLCRKAAKKIVDQRAELLAASGATVTDGKKSKKADKALEAKLPQIEITIDKDDLEELLGPPKFTAQMAELTNEIGLTNGLAYTEAGGDMLQIEVSVVPGKGNIKITGKLGDVMQESASTAMSYVRSRSEALGIDKEFYQNVDIHLHVPEGAVPKDGPSAGITMATAITSALTKIPVKRDVAMTGEITLRGRVLPIGGLKEKLLAARIGGIKTVLIPKANVPDLKKVPKEVTKGMQIIPVEHADQVLRIALAVTNPEVFLVRPDISIPDPVAYTATEKKIRSGAVKH
jgi:ATP-dependent Lon protease